MRKWLEILSLVIGICAFSTNAWTQDQVFVDKSQAVELKRTARTAPITLASTAIPTPVATYGLADPLKIENGSYPYGVSTFAVPNDQIVNFFQRQGAQDTAYPFTLNPKSYDVLNLSRGSIGYATFLLGYGDMQHPLGMPELECYDNPLSMMEQFVAQWNEDATKAAGLRVFSYTHSGEGDLRLRSGRKNQLDTTRIPRGSNQFAVYYQIPSGEDGAQFGWTQLNGGQVHGNSIAEVTASQQLQYQSQLPATGPGKKYVATAYCFARTGRENDPEDGGGFHRPRPTAKSNLFAIPPASVGNLKSDGRGGYSWQICAPKEAEKILKAGCKRVPGARWDQVADQCKCNGKTIKVDAVVSSSGLQCSAAQVQQACTEKFH